ncbi:hypothetical protein, partial [Pseudomonas syringae]|uniref:hypothetical protein n=1 Tax=Pseudomonas syringae TaxID=317 RepID=UPI001F3771A0
IGHLWWLKNQVTIQEKNPIKGLAFLLNAIYGRNQQSLLAATSRSRMGWQMARKSSTASASI